MKLFLYLLMMPLLLASSLTVKCVGKPVRVACIGASITYGATIPDRERNSYPAQLQAMLGSGYEVTNYGVSGTTLLRKGNLPYWKTDEYQAALDANPEIVIIDLGGNDAKLINRPYYFAFEDNYHEFVRSFKNLPSRPRIILLSAMTSFVSDTTGIWDRVITRDINPRIQHVAYSDGVEIIDMHSPFTDQEGLFKDKLHPDKNGAHIMAKNIYALLVQQRDTKFDISAKIDNTLKKKSSFYGYECLDFIFGGRACKVVKPKFAAAGHPWIWRARFWGHEPQTDIALLQNGFHVVYCDVAELMGNDKAVALWNNYYQLLTKAGLSKKALMEGMSRGGVYVFNWAARNPGRVAGVYVDNPLLNTSSLALKVMKANLKVDVIDDFKRDYNLVSMEDLQNFKENPVDNAKEIAAGNYPILILCADADEQVPPEDNTLLFVQEIRKLKGNISVIHKPGFRHHPHSLPNPKPIVDFLLAASGYSH